MKKLFISILIFWLTTCNVFCSEEFEAIEEFRERFKIFFNTSLGGWIISAEKSEYSDWGYPSVFLSLDYLAKDKILLGGNLFVSNFSSVRSLYENLKGVSFKRIYLGIWKESEEWKQRTSCVTFGIVNFYFDSPVIRSYKEDLDKQNFIGFEIGLLENFLGGKANLTIFYIDKEKYGLTAHFLKLPTYTIPIYSRLGKENLVLKILSGWYLLLWSPFLEYPDNLFPFWFAGIDLFSISFSKVDLR